MSTTWIAITAVISFLAIGSLLWRVLCRYYVIPWPYWLAWMLENPYMLVVAHSKSLTKKLMLEPGMVIADLGCGAGRITIPAAQSVGQKGFVFAIDLQKKMLEKVEKRAQKWGVTNIQIIQSRFKDKILPAESIDRIVLVTVLGEVPDRSNALKDMAAMLKPGGILSVTEVIPDPCYLTSSEIKRLAESAGLKPHKFWKNLLSYTYNFQKPQIPS